MKFIDLTYGQMVTAIINRQDDYPFQSSWYISGKMVYRAYVYDDRPRLEVSTLKEYIMENECWLSDHIHDLEDALDDPKNETYWTPKLIKLLDDADIRNKKIYKEEKEEQRLREEKWDAERATKQVEKEAIEFFEAESAKARAHVDRVDTNENHED